MALMLAAVPLHYVFRVLPPVGLGGVGGAVVKPELTRQAVREGVFQKNFEKLFERRCGIWAYLLRTGNQINFSLFGQIGGGYDAKVVLGRGGELLEKEYFGSAAAINTAPEKKLQNAALDLKTLQDLLTRRGITFLLLISPTKPGVYPEYIPADFQVSGRAGRRNDYERMLPMLEAAGVNLLDGHRMFMELKPAVPYPLFASSGTHWSEYGACLAAAELMRRLKALSGKELAAFACEPGKISSMPSYSECDLARLINIWFPEETYHPTLQPLLKIDRPPAPLRPDMLFEGTSFLHTLLAYLDSAGVYRQRGFYYYFSRLFTCPPSKPEPVPKEDLDWERDVFSQPFVVIEIDEAHIAEAGHGFVRRAIGKLSS